MTESIQIVLIALAALLIGVLIPVLLSIRSLVKRTEETVRRLDDDAHRVLGQSSSILERADHLASHLEKGGGTVDEVLATTEEFTHSVRALSETIRKATAVSASVGPAMVAAVTAFRAARGDHGHAEAGRSEREQSHGPAPPPPWSQPGQPTPHEAPPHDGGTSPSPPPGATAGEAFHDVR
ncbi:MAG: DUF948 domain-containing protein [Myxococcota bacterium]